MTSAALLRRLSSSLSSSCSCSSSSLRRGQVSWATFSSSFAGDVPSSSSCSSSSFPAFTNNNNNNRRQNHIERKIKWMSTNANTKRTTTTTTPTKKTDAYVAGNGDFFRLGIEDSSSSSSSSSSLSKRTFVPVHLSDNNVASIAAGGAHSLVVTESGEVFATGLNEYGQCGIKIAPEEEDKGGEDGAIMNDIVRGWMRVKFRDPGSSLSSSSSSVVEIEKVISGPASSHSVCIARGGRKVFAFGKNDRGQLGIGGAFDGKEREEGTLIAFESREEEEEEDVIIVDGATGRETTLLISANGDAYYSGKIKTDKDERFSLIGHVKEFFFPDSTSTDTAELPQTNSFRKIPGLRNIVNCSVSDACAAFVDANGKTFTIGTTSGKVLGREMRGGEGGGGEDKNAATNGFGAIEDVLLQNVSLGFNFAVAVAKSSGLLFTWGAALDDQEADSKYGLKPRLVKHEPANVNLTFTKVSSGYKHCAAITSDNRLFTWGWSGSVGSHFEDEESSAGQLGLGNDFDYPTPTEVKWKDRTTKVLDVRCGQNHTIVLASREG